MTLKFAYVSRSVSRSRFRLPRAIIAYTSTEKSQKHILMSDILHVIPAPNHPGYVYPAFFVNQKGPLIQAIRTSSITPMRNTPKLDTVYKMGILVHNIARLSQLPLSIQAARWYNIAHSYGSWAVHREFASLAQAVLGEDHGNPELVWVAAGDIVPPIHEEKQLMAEYLKFATRSIPLTTERRRPLNTLFAYNKFLSDLNPY